MQCLQYLQFLQALQVPEPSGVHSAAATTVQQDPGRRGMSLLETAPPMSARSKNLTTGTVNLVLPVI